MLILVALLTLTYIILQMYLSVTFVLLVVVPFIISYNDRSKEFSRVIIESLHIAFFWPFLVYSSISKKMSEKKKNSKV